MTKSERIWENTPKHPAGEWTGEFGARDRATYKFTMNLSPRVFVRDKILKDYQKVTKKDQNWCKKETKKWPKRGQIWPQKVTKKWPKSDQKVTKNHQVALSKTFSDFDKIWRNLRPKSSQSPRAMKTQKWVKRVPPGRGVLVTFGVFGFGGFLWKVKTKIARLLLLYTVTFFVH